MLKRTFTHYTLKNIDTENFLMTPIELKEYIPFDVKRVYFFMNSKTSTSGEHCHKIEEEFFILLKGTATAIIDRGEGKEELILRGPLDALYVPNYVWHGFKKISPDAILLALSSTNYNPDRSDYIENYDEYLQLRNEKLGIM